MYGEDSNNFDLVELECDDEYSKYINKTIHAFEMLIKLYSLANEREHEASDEKEIVLYYLKKLLHTFEVLRYKYLFDPSSSLKIDKSDSGFVNFVEIMNLETDLSFQEKRMTSFDDEYDIKQRMISHMLRYHEEPKVDLDVMGQLFYNKGLKEDKLFLFFNPGELKKLGEHNRQRHYSYYWACFDKKTNMPYIYLLDFEQDIDSVPLEEKELNAERFFEVIRSEGSRAPAAGIVAMAIDQRLSDIHPKMLKRICIGPLYSKSFSEGLPLELERLLAHGEEGRQFAFYIVEQFVFSEGSRVINDKGFLGTLLEGETVREKFYVPKPQSIAEYTRFTELEEQKASMIRKRILMPHQIRQHANGVFDEGFDLISFDKEGEINGN